MKHTQKNFKNRERETTVTLCKAFKYSRDDNQCNKKKTLFQKHIAAQMPAYTHTCTKIVSRPNYASVYI